MPPSQPSAPEPGLFSADISDLKAIELFSPSREMKVKWSVVFDDLKARLRESGLFPPPRDFGLIVRPEPLIIRPKMKPQPGLILCAPRLVFDEVTRYLSWEEMTWKQKIIEEAEREMLRPDIKWLGVDYGYGESFTTHTVVGFTDSVWSKMAKAMQLPTSYLTGRPASSTPNLQNIPIRAVSGDKNGGGLSE